MDITISQLNDKRRLQEIYDLRVKAYEKSLKAHLVNKKNYPNGWKDAFDDREDTIHWIAEHDNKIIGAARLVIVESITKVGEFVSKFSLPEHEKCAYWSRLVVHPDYRRTRTMQKLDSARKDYVKKNIDIKYTICWVTPERVKSVIRLGFEPLGKSKYHFADNESIDIEVFKYII